MKTLSITRLNSRASRLRLVVAITLALEFQGYPRGRMMGGPWTREMQIELMVVIFLSLNLSVYPIDWTFVEAQFGFQYPKKVLL